MVRPKSTGVRLAWLGGFPTIICTSCRNLMLGCHFSTTLAFVEALSAEAPVRRPPSAVRARTRARWVVAVAVVLLAVAGVWWVRTSGTGATELDPNLVAAFPFRMSGADEQLGSPLHAFERLCIDATAVLDPQPPDEHDTGDCLDEAVDTEGDERDRATGQAGDHSDESLEDVPADREVLEQQTAADERLSSHGRVHGNTIRPFSLTKGGRPFEPVRTR